MLDVSSSVLTHESPAEAVGETVDGTSGDPS